jgi:hypothetical protein
MEPRQETNAALVDLVGRLDPAGNVRISSWIAEHLRVAIVAFPDRDRLGSIEEAVVAAIDPPLNLDHCAPSAIRVQLRTLRAMLRTTKPSSPATRSVSDLSET